MQIFNEEYEKLNDLIVEREGIRKQNVSLFDAMYSLTEAILVDVLLFASDAEIDARRKENVKNKLCDVLLLIERIRIWYGFKFDDIEKTLQDFTDRTASLSVSDIYRVEMEKKSDG